MNEPECSWLEQVEALSKNVSILYLENIVVAFRLWKATTLRIVCNESETELTAHFSKRPPEPQVLGRPEILWLDGNLDEADRRFCEGIRSALCLKPNRLVIKRRGSSFAMVEIIPHNCTLNSTNGKAPNKNEASLVVHLSGGKRDLRKEELWVSCSDL